MLVILDKDGTLVEPASGGQWVTSPEDQRLLPGVAERIAELKAMGATLVIASNQGGVAAGHKTLKDAIAEMRFCLELIPEITSAYFCPDFEGQICWLVRCYPRDISGAWQLNEGDWQAGIFGQFRKPNPGMLKAFMSTYLGVAGSDAVMIGDRPEDRDAALAAGIPFIDAQAWRDSTVSALPNGAFIA